MKLSSNSACSIVIQLLSQMNASAIAFWPAVMLRRSLQRLCFGLAC